MNKLVPFKKQKIYLSASGIQVKMVNNSKTRQWLIAIQITIRCRIQDGLGLIT